MDIQAQKAIMIEQFKQVNDMGLINAIKSMLDYALQKESNVYSIPEQQQDIVMERFEKIRRNPKRLLDWGDAKNTLHAIVKPNNNTLRFPIPDNYIGRQVEVIAFLIDEEKETASNRKKEVSSNAVKLDTIGFKFNRDEANER